MPEEKAAAPSAPGRERWEVDTRQVGRQTRKQFAYYYLHTNGEVFMCIKPTLEGCRKSRDLWLEGR